MYVIPLQQAPLTVYALWNGQHVNYMGAELIMRIDSGEGENQRIFFTTVESNPDPAAYERDLARFMSGVPGVSLPHYYQYYRHLRINGHEPVATREEFYQAMIAGRCTIG